MNWFNISFENLRAPMESSFPPVREPEDPPENPDVPIREPDPEEPNQM